MEIGSVVKATFLYILRSMVRSSGRATGAFELTNAHIHSRTLPWNLALCEALCDMTCSYVWHQSFMCAS